MTEFGSPSVLTPGAMRVIFAPVAGGLSAEGLDAGERARLMRIRTPDARDRYLTLHHLTRGAVARAVGQPPAELVIERSCERCGKEHGRPRLADDDAGVSFSGSNGRGWVGVAVARGLGPVGFDLGRQLTPTERRHLASLVRAPGDRPTSGVDVAASWVRKEAVLKAAGVGLFVEMAAVHVVEQVGRWDAVVDDPAARRRAWLGRDVPAPPGHLSAVAFLTAPRHLDVATTQG